ncbi:CRISPR-associated helicase, Cas3 family [Clostridium sp. DSM 8431]|uniref:CRISPR-associated helicase/endonuclease Cas3 n=1 Tax=Clostridium sp. DSM 8431 TaxID=1761781 RepID=UPI0008EBEEE4|nr:CRISPR-associated helicase/endonuclease Cas3 [Clostridium sp. DSM 8431]SFU69161.1 CRISPR-associated helicase, Cas3 family [Clostridium sp. DSM 8431]
MKDIFKILDNETLKLIKNRSAKEDKTIYEHTEDLLNELNILNEYGYIEDKRIYELVEKAIIYHDLGKLNVEFQKRLKKGGRFKEDIEVSHNILSLYFIDPNSFETKDDYIRVSHAVFNHHYYCNNYEELSNKKELIDKLLKEFKTVNVKRRTKSLLAEIVKDIDAIKIKGYLHKCDYSASSNKIIEYPADFLRGNMDRLLKVWQKNKITAKWNELQNFCIQNTSSNIIAVAQTGMGKTEGGLLWMGDNKGFFILPIRAAINAIYDRVRNNILNNERIEKRLAILHSSSLEYYINNYEYESEENKLIEYEKTGKQLAIPLNIATMDSIFDFVFKYPSYELKLTTLSYSKIVIDEIQAYGPELLAYLIYGIEKVNEMGGKIAILTATLPPFVKYFLKRKINFIENDKPFITDLKRHNIKVLDKKICAEDIKERYLENKKKDKSNKVLVVCNTIKEAQKIYEELNNEESIENCEINILHSKFIRKERLEKESQIMSDGRTFDEHGEIYKKNCIWIATSIVEASLDIDFDYLFTELQELNSLFQRLGRCNRKGVKNIDEYNCFVYCQINEKYFIDGDKGFIDKTLFNLSKEATLSCDGILSEEEKIKLIDKYLTYDNLKDSDYIRTFNDVYEYISLIPPYKFDIKDKNLRNILSQDIIPGSVYEENLGTIKYIQEKLLDYELSEFDRAKYRDQIMKYTVSVYLGDIQNYERARSKGTAIPYDRVSLSRFKNDYIKVIDCIYDESGYKKKKYGEEFNKAVIF